MPALSGSVVRRVGKVDALIYYCREEFSERCAFLTTNRPGLIVSDSAQIEFFSNRRTR
jgi:hypothetical protein